MERTYDRASARAYPPQRNIRPIIILACVACFIAVSVFISTSKIDYTAPVRQEIQHLASNVHNIQRPFSHLHNPFKQSTHAPPAQANSTRGDTAWFSDWKWLNPFSSTITLDENRALLPPLTDRPNIYTYYEASDQKDDDVKKAEERLLLIWRRAWWSQGFKPVVLGPAEAVEHPLYASLKLRNMTIAVENEMMRWMAWSHMGDGILANWLVLPMASFDQALLAYLRAARYPELTRYEEFGSGLFAGAQAGIDNALSTSLKSPTLDKDKTFLGTLADHDKDVFHVEPRPKGAAFYDFDTVKVSYTDIADSLEKSRAKGLNMLADLITAHLHSTFLSIYPKGIAVVSPFKINATILSYRALSVADLINACPKTPSGSASTSAGCPPNNPKCEPCKKIPQLYPSSVPNDTKIFTLGTVPHPYTLSILQAPRDPESNLSVAYIRRSCKRDPWVEAITLETQAKGISSYKRIVGFKESTAQIGKGAMRSIWRIAEQDWDWEDLEWRLGYSLKRPAKEGVSSASGGAVPQDKIMATVEAMGLEKSYPDVMASLLESMEKQRPLRTELLEQGKIVKMASDAVHAKKWVGKSGKAGTAGEADLKAVTEAWHLADSEAWRFVRALEAREDVERRRWAEEENKFKH